MSKCKICADPTISHSQVGGDCLNTQTWGQTMNATHKTDALDMYLWRFILDVGKEYASGKPRHASRFDELREHIQTHYMSRYAVRESVTKTELDKETKL